MEESEFRNAVIAHLSREGFVQSYRTQLRLALHKYASSSRDFPYPAYQHSLRSELICNIIADYFQAYQYRSTLHVFVEESSYHKIPISDVMRQLEIPELDRTLLETLMKRKQRPSGSRSAGCQTDQLSVTERLTLIDSQTRIARSAARSHDRQRMVTDRLEAIRQEKEAQFEERLRHAFESARAVEMSRLSVESSERFHTEMERVKADFELQFLNRSHQLRLAREHEEASTRMLQEELDRQLEALRKGEPAPQSDPDPVNLDALRKRWNVKLNKLLNEGKKLVKEREIRLAQIAEEEVEYQKSLKVLEQLRQQFAAIQVT
jgi:hypothetical protein